MRNCYFRLDPAKSFSFNILIGTYIYAKRKNLLADCTWETCGKSRMESWEKAIKTGVTCESVVMPRIKEIRLEIL